MKKVEVAQEETYGRSGRIERRPERLVIRGQRRMLRLLLLFALFPWLLHGGGRRHLHRRLYTYKKERERTLTHV
jgi:hypothetical protein